MTWTKFSLQAQDDRFKTQRNTNVRRLCIMGDKKPQTNEWKPSNPKTWFAGVLCNSRSYLVEHKNMPWGSILQIPTLEVWICTLSLQRNCTNHTNCLNKAMELSWVQGAWNHCPLSVRFTFLYSLHSASYSEVMAWGGALKRSKSSGKHLLKVITPHYPEVEITPQQQTEKRKGKGCSGFQKNQLTSSNSLLGRCVSAESRYCPQTWFGAGVQPALL